MVKYKANRYLKMIVILIVITFTMVIFISCDKKEVIKVSLDNQSVYGNELLSKDLELDYYNDTDKIRVFTSKEEYSNFTNKYFKDNLYKDFDFDKYDLLYMDDKVISQNNKVVFVVDYISNTVNNVDISIKHNGEITFENTSKDAIVKTSLCVKLDKGILSNESNFKVLNN